MVRAGTGLGHGERGGAFRQTGSNLKKPHTRTHAYNRNHRKHRKHTGVCAYHPAKGAPEPLDLHPLLDHIEGKNGQPVVQKPHTGEWQHQTQRDRDLIIHVYREKNRLCKGHTDLETTPASPPLAKEAAVGLDPNTCWYGGRDRRQKTKDRVRISSES